MTPEPTTALPPDAICPHCGYSLLGLPNSLCPECGVAFDASDSSTDRRIRPKPPWSGRRILVPLLAAGVVAAGFSVSQALAWPGAFTAWVLGPLTLVDLVMSIRPLGSPWLLVGALFVTCGTLGFTLAHVIRPNRRNLERSVIGLLLWFGHLPLAAAVMIIRQYWP